jgi:hypothetical protein
MKSGKRFKTVIGDISYDEKGNITRSGLPGQPRGLALGSCRYSAPTEPRIPLIRSQI